MTVEISEQVEAFVRCLAPEPRRRLRLAIRALAEGQGDIRSLEGRCKNYQRLRCGVYRVIFTVRFVAGSPVVQCLFAERRSIVYEAFEKMIGG